MELESRKLELIDYLSRLQDEELLGKIEDLIKESRKPAKLKPFTKKEYLRMIEKSEEDVRKGRVYTQEEVVKYFKAKK
jgi:hypothetical protein